MTPRAHPPRFTLLFLISLLWVVLAWYLAAFAPRLAFLPGVEALFLALPLITAGLIALNLWNALRRLWTGDPAISLLPNTAVQVLLFTVLFFQLSAHLGAEHYKLDGPATAIDWFGFSLAHAFRASDVFDAVEAFGLRLQAIRHEGWLVGAVLVLYHLVVNVFILSLLWGLWRQVTRWLGGHPSLRLLVVLGLVAGFLVWLEAWLLYALWLRPWNPSDIPWWFLECLLRVVDCVDCIDSFGVRLHNVPHEWIEGSLTIGCRLYMALGIGLIAGLFRREREVQPDDSGIPPGRSLALALSILVLAGLLLIPADILASPEGALPSLVAAVQNESGTQPALRALRRMGPAAASVLGDLEPRAQGALAGPLCEVFGYLGPDAAEPLGRIALVVEGGDFSTVVIALRRVGPHAAPQLARVWAASEAERQELCARSLQELGVQAVGPLVTTMTEENYVTHHRWIKELDPYWTLRSTSNPLFAQAQRIPRLTEELNSRQESHRAAAATEAGQCGLPARELVPALMKQASNDQHQPRRAALVALGELGPHAIDSVAVLVEALAAPEDDIRRESQKSLQTIDPEWIKLPLVKKSAPVLIAQLANGTTEVRLALLEVLVEITPVSPEVATALGSLLGDPNAGVQQATLELLDKLGTKACPILAANLGDKNGAALLNALNRLGPKARGTVPALFRWTGVSKVGGMNALRATLNRIDPNWLQFPETQEALMEALERLGHDKEPIRLHSRAVLELFPPEWPTRAEGRAAIAPLTQLLLSQERAVRQESIEWLARIDADWLHLPQTRQVFSTLLTRLVEPNLNNRTRTLEHLGLLDKEWRKHPDVKTLVNRVAGQLNAPVMETRGLATLLLIELKPASLSAVPVLLKHLGEGQEPIAAMVTALDQLEPTWRESAAGLATLALTVQRILKGVPTDNWLATRTALQAFGPAIQKMTEPIPALIAATVDPMRKDQSQLLETLQLIDPAVTNRAEWKQALLALADRFKEPEAAASLGSLFSRIGPACEAAVPKLVEYLLASDPATQEAARQALRERGQQLWDRREDVNPIFLKKATCLLDPKLEQREIVLQGLVDMRREFKGPGLLALRAVPILIESLDAVPAAASKTAKALDRISGSWRGSDEASKLALRVFQRLRDRVHTDEEVKLATSVLELLELNKYDIRGPINPTGLERRTLLFEPVTDMKRTDALQLVDLLNRVIPAWHVHPDWQPALGRLTNELKNMDPAVRKEVWSRLQSLGPACLSGLSTLIEHLSGPDGAQALATLRKTSQGWVDRESLEWAIHDWIGKSKDPKPEIHGTAVKAISQVAMHGRRGRIPVATVAALVPHMESPDQSIRLAAVRALGKLGWRDKPVAQQAIRERLKGEKDADVLKALEEAQKQLP